MGSDLRTSASIGIAVALALAFFGLAARSLDVHPLDGFWTSQPFDLAVFVGPAAASIAFILRRYYFGIDARNLSLKDENAKQHKATRDEFKEILLAHTRTEEVAQKALQIELHALREDVKEDVKSLREDTRALQQLIMRGDR